jgi:hypothetical protein
MSRPTPDEVTEIVAELGLTGKRFGFQKSWLDSVC